jgi:hypothetical protein
MMDYVLKEKLHSMVEDVMLLQLHMDSIHVNTHEGGGNDDQKDGGGRMRSSADTS